MFTGVLVTEKHGKIFTRELKVCNEGQHDYWRGTVSTFKYLLKFLSGVRLFASEISFVRHFVPGRFIACPGTDFALIFSPG